LGEATFAEMGGKGEDAPIPAIGPASIELVKATLTGQFAAFGGSFRTLMP
jgi:hypothetical protein